MMANMLIVFCECLIWENFTVIIVFFLTSCQKQTILLGKKWECHVNQYQSTMQKRKKNIFSWNLFTAQRLKKNEKFTMNTAEP